ncbi:MAG: hypothetical protein Tsb0010_07020 [Parvularculaceae bacterium]
MPSPVSHSLTPILFAPATRPAAPEPPRAALAPIEAGGKSALDVKNRGEDGKRARLGELSEEEKKQVEELRKRDQEVRRHEEAHARVGGQYAGRPSYEYQSGPDGRQYAVSGEVPIDAAPIPDDPEATIEKMEIVKAAALAPAEPSGQDRKVAAKADSERLKAQAELAAKRAKGEDHAEGASDEKAVERADAKESETQIDVSDLNSHAKAGSSDRIFAQIDALSRPDARNPGPTPEEPPAEVRPYDVLRRSLRTPLVGGVVSITV